MKKNYIPLPKMLEKKRDKQFRYVFEFDLSVNEFNSGPIIVLDTEEVYAYTNSNSFHPSALEIHPSKNTFFTLSAKNRILLEFSRSGELLNVAKLKKKFHRQAEAITFDDNGNLYIGDEAAGETATLSQYENKHP